MCTELGSSRVRCGFDGQPPPLATFPSVVCECCDESCDETSALTLEEYERVRADANRFAVLPGHEVAEVEQVVEATDRYVVVAKLGAGGQVAERLDPRRRRGG